LLELLEALKQAITRRLVRIIDEGLERLEVARAQRIQAFCPLGIPGRGQPGEGDQFVGDSGHGRHHDHLRLVLAPNQQVHDMRDALGIGQRRPAELVRDPVHEKTPPRAPIRPAFECTRGGAVVGGGWQQRWLVCWLAGWLVRHPRALVGNISAPSHRS
jgi:hypothetical protein